MNTSEERLVSVRVYSYSPTFILYHQNSARWSGHLIIYLLCRYWGGGVENIFGGVDILFGGRLAPPAPPRKSVYGVTHFALA